MGKAWRAHYACPHVWLIPESLGFCIEELYFHLDVFGSRGRCPGSAKGRPVQQQETFKNSSSLGKYPPSATPASLVALERGGGGGGEVAAQSEMNLHSRMSQLLQQDGFPPAPALAERKHQ